MIALPTLADVQVGRRIIAARIFTGCSQTALAAMLGISRQRLMEYEIGSVRPSVPGLLQIAESLGRQVGWFFEDGSSEAGDR